MDIKEFNNEFQKVIDETSKYWDSNAHKKLFDEYSNNKGQIDLNHLYALLHDESAQYANQLVYNALSHFFVDNQKD